MLLRNVLTINLKLKIKNVSWKAARDLKFTIIALLQEKNQLREKFTRMVQLFQPCQFILISLFTNLELIKF